MASHRAIALAQSSPHWREFFAHQQAGQFARALAVAFPESFEPSETLLLSIYRCTLRFFLGPARLDPGLVAEAQNLVVQAQRFGGACADLELEALLLVYDMHVTHRSWTSEALNGAVRALVVSEPSMTADTAIRWLRRKAAYLRKCGQLQEALNVLGSLIPRLSSLAPPDDSLALTLYELSRVHAQTGRYAEALEALQSALVQTKSLPNRCAIVARLCNLLDRLGQTSHAELRRGELFALWGTPMPVHCGLCHGNFTSENVALKTVLFCCRSVVHSECLLRDLCRKLGPASATNLSAPCGRCATDIEVLDSFHSLAEIHRRLQASDLLKQQLQIAANAGLLSSVPQQPIPPQ